VESWPRLYLTHPRVRKDEGDCAHLARQLRLVGLDAVYDPIEVRPGVNPWTRAASRFKPCEDDAWVYLITPKWLSNRECSDGLIEVLEIACRKGGEGLPRLGLLHGVAAQDLPPALKLLPCVHVAASDWKEQVRSAISAGPLPFPENRAHYYAVRLEPVPGY